MDLRVGACNRHTFSSRERERGVPVMDLLHSIIESLSQTRI